MSDDRTYILVASCNNGRYAGNDAQYGPDLTSGRCIEIEVMPGVWIPGRVEYAAYMYNVEQGKVNGYYFISEGGHIIGLCTGMRVKM